MSVPDADDVEWVAEMRRRSSHILDLLRRDPVLARTELDSWADQSATALGLIRTAGGFAEL